jgi:hypothetical protein
MHESNDVRLLLFETTDSAFGTTKYMSVHMSAAARGKFIAQTTRSMDMILIVRNSFRLIRVPSLPTKQPILDLFSYEGISLASPNEGSSDHAHAFGKLTAG